MYTSPDEARSDLFLAGAVYLFGPVVLDILLRIVPVTRIGGVAIVLAVVQPLIFTILVPFLLIRYRRESLAMYGLGPRSGGLTLGIVVSVPVVVAILGTYLLGARLLVGPVFLGMSAALPVASRLSHWIGLAGLAVYGTVKARDAFRSDSRTIREGVTEIGRVLAIVVAVATVLLFAVLGLQAELLLVPLGAAGMVLLALRMQRGPSFTSRAALLTPAVLLALGPFALFTGALEFVVNVWRAAIVASVGLTFGMFCESRRSALPALGLAVVLALFTGL